MASGNYTLMHNIKDFNQKLQNSLLQLRARNPFINQKNMMNQDSRSNILTRFIQEAL